jgi:hypothetical protein
MELEREVFDPSAGELDLFDEDCEPMRLSLENEERVYPKPQTLNPDFNI